MTAKRIFIATLSVVALAALAACATKPSPNRPLELAKGVDVSRFMGDWYVIAGIETRFERDAHNSLEQYTANADGTIATTFSFNDGGFDGPKREFRSKAFVDPANPAVWGQQYIWPIKADYRVAWVSPDYAQTVVGREKRDFVWIMARTPTIPEADYERLKRFIGEQGYDVEKLRRVPQSARRNSGG